MTKQKLIVGVGLILALLGCSKEDETGAAIVAEPVAPVLVQTVTGVTIPVNTSFTIATAHVEAHDDNGDALTVIAYAGENYTVVGATITPTLDFLGDLRVPVQVSDGILLSRIDTLTISVVSDLAMTPLFEGAWWQYDDTISGSETQTSRMDVYELSILTMAGAEISAHKVQWSDYAKYGVYYLMSSDPTGTTLHGGYSASDTLISPQQLHRFPVTLNESWSYQALRYNATDSAFIREPASTNVMTCTNTAIAITVPAGVFNCIELTYSYPMTLRSARSESSVIDLFAGTESVVNQVVNSRAVVSVTEKFYYSVGVGMVQHTTMVGESLVWKKVLTDFSVVEPITTNELPL